MHEILRNIILCNRCELRQLSVNDFHNSVQLMDSDNFIQGNIMVVAQNPSFIRGKSHVLGDATSRNDAMFLDALKLLGISRVKCYCTNIVKDSTAKNEDPTRFVSVCSTHLFAELNYIKPPLIVALGAVSKTFFGGDMNKFSLWSTVYGRYPIFSTYHPSYLIRNGRSYIEMAKFLQPVKEYCVEHKIGM